MEESIRWSQRILRLTKTHRERDLYLHLGQEIPQRTLGGVPSVEDLRYLRQLLEKEKFPRALYFEAVDHFVRTQVEPFQALLSTWMSGAKTYVHDQVIPFNDVISWCQEASDPDERQIISKEVRSLCRFLAQFSVDSWEVLITTLVDVLEYPSYLDYNEQKRGILLDKEAREAQEFLSFSRQEYFNAIEPFVIRFAGKSLDSSSRFDAIYLLGLRYLDHFFPSSFDIKDVGNFFNEWGLDFLRNEKIKVHETPSGLQSYCFPVEIPDNIHILVGQLRGWLDLESLFHELGHALSLAWADASLPAEKANLLHSAAFSESFAFLFQRMCMSPVFLMKVLGMDGKSARYISSAHSMKWLTLTRRYAAKLVIEVENFKQRVLRKGQSYYAEVMKNQVGFMYDPDTYLFDLMPDFYSLDYFQGFIGSAMISKFLVQQFGDEWFFKKESADMLHEWWRGGNRFSLPQFLENHVAPYPDFTAFMEQLGELRREW